MPQQLKSQDPVARTLCRTSRCVALAFLKGSEGFRGFEGPDGLDGREGLRARALSGFKRLGLSTQSFAHIKGLGLVLMDAIRQDLLQGAGTGVLSRPVCGFGLSI